MPCSPGDSSEILTSILTPWPISMSFAVPIFAPCAFTMSTWTELWAAAAKLTAAESDKSTAITKRIRKRIANLLRGDPILQCSEYYHTPKVLKITQPQSVGPKSADVQ